MTIILHFQPQPKNGKEVTIAKLGRFKFSVEVAKQFDEELTKSKETGSGGQSGNGSNNKKATENTNNKNRKISRKETRETKAEGGSEQQPKSSTSPSKSRKLEKEPSAVAKLPSIHVTNFNAQKVLLARTTEGREQEWNSDFGLDKDRKKDSWQGF